MKYAWQYGKRGSVQLRPYKSRHWQIWIEKQYIITMRPDKPKRRNQVIAEKWSVWLVNGPELPGGRVDRIARFKSLKQAKKFALAAVRIE